MSRGGYTRPPEEKRLYDSSRWRKVAKNHLANSPLCIPCLRAHRDTPATIVHHKKEHKGDPALFWDPDNFESVCASCHSGHIRVGEHQGYSQACDDKGFPLDDNHPFWRK